jgi:selenocysteine lyase/cysteine desulfurase
MKRAAVQVTNTPDRLLDRSLQSLPVRIYGSPTPTNGGALPTVSFTSEAPSPAVMSIWRGGIHAWDGDFYAPAVTERLGLQAEGADRVGTTTRRPRSIG